MSGVFEIKIEIEIRANYFHLENKQFSSIYAMILVAASLYLQLTSK